MLLDEGEDDMLLEIRERLADQADSRLDFFPLTSH